MKTIVLDCKKDYTMAIKCEGEYIEDFFVIKNDSNVGDVFVGRIENIRGKQCFVNYDETRKNGIMETKGKPFKIGDYIKCQVIREEMDDKGAILDGKINLAGNFAILSSNLRGYKFSRRLDVTKAELLRNNLDKSDYGFIIRSQAGEVPVEIVANEIVAIAEIYTELLKKEPNGKICKIYAQNSIAKALNEVNPYGCRVVANRNENIINQNIEVYDGFLPILDFFNLRKSVNELFETKVVLSTGIELVIERTEAMHIIDVNLKGYFGGKNDLGNKLAAKEIARQIRLRNLAGLIVVDFITTKKTDELVKYINELLLEDREKAEAVALPKFSIVAINRKKRYNSVKSIFFQKCSCCDGVGDTKSTQYYCEEIVADALRLYNDMKYKNIIIHLEPKLFEEMKNNDYSKLFMKLPVNVNCCIKEMTGRKGSSFETTDDTSILNEALRI